MSFDWNLFLALNSLAGRSPWLDASARFLAEDAFLLFGLLLVALWFLPGHEDVHRAHQLRVVNATIALAAALLTAHLIGLFFYRPRPFIGHTVIQLISHPPDSSFPSDHTALAFTFIVALWPALGRTSWFWLAWGALIGLARVIAGVHFPTDVLGGALLGAIWGVLALAFAGPLARVEAPLLKRLVLWRLA